MEMEGNLSFQYFRGHKEEFWKVHFVIIKLNLSNTKINARKIKAIKKDNKSTAFLIHLRRV